jgi:imidazolonepropionase-like amidohydrolase
MNHQETKITEKSVKDRSADDADGRRSKQSLHPSASICVICGFSFLVFLVSWWFIQTAAAAAKETPVELDEDRKPAIVTRGTCFIRGGTLLTVTHGVISNGSLLVRDGKIAAIGKELRAPEGVPVIEAAGRFVTPGLIDAHSHIAADAINESADSVTAEVRIEDVLDPDDLSIYRALAGGVTAALILHGSANVIGGQSCVIKMKWRHPVGELVVPDAPRTIKFALGENVKRSNFRTDSARFPATRMGVESVLRRAFEEARRYRQTWERYERERQSDPGARAPRRDLRLEALADVLAGKIWVHCHAYRADEMLMLLRLSREYGFKIASFQHALEAYKIAPEIAAQGVAVSTFADFWSYKVEAYDAIPYNAAFCTRAGILASVNSDDAERMRRLNLDAAKSIRYGGLDENEALKLVTLNPAKQLGIAHRAGSLEVGRDADLALWDAHPLSVYARCVMTLVDGEVLFQRRDAFGVDRDRSPPPPLAICRADHLALRMPSEARAYAIVDATVHPISGPDIPRGAVLIDSGRIQAVGPKVPIPRHAVVVHAPGLHVYPGLIDAGSELGLAEVGAVRATIDTSEGGELQPDLLALTAVNPASEHFAVTRFAGITAALTRPTGGLLSGQSAVIRLAGWTPDEMSLRSPVALHLNFPAAPGAGPRFTRARVAPEERRRRREEYEERLRRLREFFERAKRYEAARAQAPDRAPYDPRLEAMIPYVTGKRPVILHADAAPVIRAALQFAEPLGLKVILAGGRDAWKVADLLAQKHISLIYGPVYKLPASDEDPYDAVYAAPAVLHRAGVPLCFQSADAAMSRDLPHQAGIACAYGLPHAAALRAVTLDAAQILGVGDLLGSLEPGKLADLIVTDGDPLEITTSVHNLFIAGKPVPLESKQTRLYQLYRQRPTRMPASSAEGRDARHREPEPPSGSR